MSKNTSKTHEQTQNPLILAVETSGRLGSVAIAMGPNLLCEKSFSAPMKHSEELFPTISELLESQNRKPEQIEHIYISIGPGSFTGLRIAATLAKTMHLANKTKIVAVDTLDGIAANVVDAEVDKIAAILDAKRKQFFIAVYQNRQGQWEKCQQDCLMTSEQFLKQFANSKEPVWLLGEGLVYYKKEFEVQGTRFFDEKYWYPSAGNVHRLGWQKVLAGEFADALELVPKYLRRPEVKEKKR